jgi:hypothetical protein
VTTTAAQVVTGTGARPAPVRTTLRMHVRAWLVPGLLFLVALAVRMWAIGQVGYATNEGSAYYVGVARNLVEGRGLVTDSMWSYGTPPLVFPRPAFELWLPLASFVAALPMTLVGTSLFSAQVGFAVLGATLAPMAWLVARDAAIRLHLEPGRVGSVAIGSALLVALLGPLVEATIAPDSTLPFTVLGVAACLLMGRILAASGGAVAARVALGLCLGLAYLARQEAAWLALTFALLVLADARGALRSWPSAVAAAARGVAVPAIVAISVVVPWLLRDLAVFGTPFPGQTIENAWLIRNEQIFAYGERPTMAAFLAQGPAVIAGHIGGALVNNAMSVVVIAAAPAGLVGLIALFAFRRSPALRQPSPLAALVLSGLLTYVVTTVVFPVASAWGTFRHGAGPLIVALAVLSVLAADAAIARLRRFRDWPRSNAFLAPLLLVAVTLPLTMLQVGLSGAAADAAERRFAAARAAVGGTPGVLMSDQPIRLAEELRRPVLALPDEAPEHVRSLADRFDVSLLVILDSRGRYPAALDAGSPGSTCFSRRTDPPHDPLVAGVWTRSAGGCAP